MKISREEYLWQLEQNLHRIPAEEREAALEYYRNYFEEAGSENEENVMRELGSPEELAKTIIADVMDSSRHDTVQDPLAKRGETYGSQNAFQEPGWEKYRRQMEREERETMHSENREHREKPRRKGINGWAILCLLLTIPIWGGLLLGLFGMIFGLMAGLIGILIGLVAVVLGGIITLIVGAVIGLIKAVVLVITAPFAAGFIICLAVVMLAVGGLLINLFIALVKRLVPGILKLIGRILTGIVRGITGLVRRILGSR